MSKKEQSMCQRETIPYRLTNHSKIKRFLLAQMANALLPFQKIRKNMEKNMEKVENYFPNEPLSQRSEN